MGAKYTIYPEGKTTEEETLPRIPAHWSTRRVRFVLRDGAEGIKIGPFGSALRLEDMVDSGVQVYGQENVIKNDFTLGNRLISNEKFTEMEVYEVFPGDLLITMMGTSGKCELVPHDAERGIIDSHLLRLRVNENEISPEFFRLLIDESPEIKHQITVQGKGSIMHGLNSSIVKSLVLPLPNRSEQNQIVSFLDHETAKLDTLIDKQQQIIKLLKEKRQAVISHAVTKGLNLNTPLKNSGVEWLGEIPEGWGTSRLKYLTSQIVDGAHFTPTYVNNGVPFLRVTDIHCEEIDFANLKFIPESEHIELVKRCNPQKGDLLLSKNGTIGVPKIVDWGWEFSIFVSLCLIRPNDQLNVNYAYYFFLTHEIHEQIFGLIKQSTVVNLHLDKIENLYFTVPPIEEQKAIADYLDSTIGTYDQQLNKAEKLRLLLKERRTALISAAVTGKIDVRNWQPVQAETPREASA